MTPDRQRALNVVLTALVVISLLFSYVAPVATLIVRAQEATDEPTAPPLETTAPPETATPTSTEPAPTETATAEPTETAAPTAETPTAEAPTEETPTAEATPTPPSFPPADATLFEDAFSDGDAAGWTLSPGWQVVPAGADYALSAATPLESAAVNGLNWEHLLLAARLYIEPGAEVRLALRASAEQYDVALDADGRASLYRSGALLAQGPQPEADPNSTPAPVWRTLNVHLLGDTLTVGVNGAVQFVYQDPQPLPAGALAFTTGPESAAVVMVDDVVIHRLEMPTETPTPTPDAPATPTPPTDEPAAPEASETPTTEPSDTSTEAADEQSPALAVDFEDDLVGWAITEGASVVETNDGRALLLAPGSALLPAEPVYLADLELRARFSLADSSSALRIAFRASASAGYALAFTSEQIALYRAAEAETVLVASSAANFEAGVWHAVVVSARGGAISVSVDGTAALDFADDVAIASGQLAFSAEQAAVLLDDIAVYDLTPVELLPTPTPVPLGLTEEETAKLHSVLAEVLDLYLRGETEAALAMAADYGMPALDDALRVQVVVYTAPDFDIAALPALVERVGGIVDFVGDKSVEARVPLPAVRALVNADDVAAVVLPHRAVSTSSAASVPGAPSSATGAGTVVPHSVDILGANDWHTPPIINGAPAWAAITGAAVRVAVIDTSFAGIALLPPAERSCLISSPAGGSAISHGARVVETICDIAPASRVTTYTANSAAALTTAINNARAAGNRIILITLDLGVSAGPGDGTDGNANYNPAAPTSPYDAIRAAREAGILVIVSAGNNNLNRYASFAYAGTPMTFQVAAQTGDIISLSWNDWDSQPNGGATRENFQLQVVNGSTTISSVSRAPGADPGLQVVIPAGFSSPTTFTATITRLGGDSTSDFLQFQTSGTITGFPTGVTANTTRTLGRPGDSTYALTVGAVCSALSSRGELENAFPVMPSSSRGPLYAAGGNDGAGPAGVFKPDLVGPSHIVVWGDSSVNDGLNGCIDGSGNAAEPDPPNGFNGTSAAAAHVAGMAALLIANTNPDMAAFDSGSGAANAIQHYLQSHAIDRDGNGFDDAYGAGLPVLGQPNYVRPTLPASPLSDGFSGRTLYVSSQTGVANPAPDDFSRPYLHLQHAINQAVNGDRVVLLPGEYVSPIVFNNRQGIQVVSYSDLVPGSGASTIVTNNSYGGVGAVVFTGNVTGTSLSGFQFYGTRLLSSSNALPAVTFTDATGGALRNSVLQHYALALPVVIENSAESAVSGSVFENNGDNTGATTAAVKIVDSSNVNLENNTFRSNQTRLDTTNASTNAVITFERSGGTVARSLFTANSTEGLISVNNDEPSQGIVNIFSNLMLNNATRGQLVHLDPGPRFRFTHNTVVGHTLDAGYKSNGYQAIIVRGRPSTPATYQQQWDIHNNIFFSNANFDYIADDPSRVLPEEPFNSLCQASNPDGSPNGVNNSGATNNWIFNSSFNLGGGDCGPALETSSNNNITAVNPAPGYPAADPNTSKFTGPRLGLATTDPLYYQLLQSTPENPNPAVDRGNSSVPTSSLDLRGRPRVVNSMPDIGAYELVLLSASSITNEARQEDTFDQPGDIQPTDTVHGAFRIDPRARVGRDGGVEGGFEPYTFSIINPPVANFSTDTSDFCGGLGVRVSRDPNNPADTKQYIYYCPPEHFYTSAGAQVVIAYRAQDSSGAAVESTIQVNIAPTPDTRLTQPAGGAPWVSYRLVTETGSDFRLRLRPYVQFNNFSFSEANSDTGTPARGVQADYPFTYGSVSVWPANDNTPGREVTYEANYNPNLFGPNPSTYIQNRIAAAGPDGVITLTPEPNQFGFMIFEYQATDSHSGPGGPGTVTGRVRLEVVGSIPDRGLHDDTSFAFSYGNLNPTRNGSWTASASEPNINNTLHTTTALDDVATFNFVGEGFTLYMQAHPAGGFWDLRVDGFDLTWDPPQPNGERRGRVLVDGVQTEGFTCTTRAFFLRDWAQGRDRLTNYGFAPYTVSCRDLRDGEAHTVEIINRQAFRWLRVDAFSIMFKTDPLLPGFHDVNIPEVRQLFTGSWQQLTDFRASNRIAMFTNSAAANDLEFTFRGTGFAIGTTLEGVYDVPSRTFKGAVYDICVKAASSGPSDWVCQEFNNGVGAFRAPVFGAHRPFYGFANGVNDVHQARLSIKELPAGARLVVDSITVFDQEPTAPLPPGTTENDVVGPIVFGNGQDDSWAYSTIDRRASNRSLHSIAFGVNNAGPFVSFQLPASADRFEWTRVAVPTIDSQQVLVCVNRARGGPAGTQDDYCVKRDLRTATNPLVVRASDIPNWASAVGGSAPHTVEIFSLVNSPFNFDKVAVFDSSAPLSAGYYEEFTLEPSSPNSAYRYNGAWTDLRWPLSGPASGLAVKQTDEAGANVIFEMNGTGFTAYFTTDRFAGSAKICWLAGPDHDVDTVRTTGACRTYNNYLPYALYKIPRVVVGLSATPADFTVVITNVPNNSAQTTMKFDAVEIHNHTLSELLLDQPGQRYETSFKQFSTDAAATPFFYYGAGWNTVEGPWIRTYSGNNYDQSVYRQGAGFAFRTSGVDLIRIVRPAIFGWSTMEICASGVDFDAVAPGQNCLLVPGQQNPVIVQLPNTDQRIITVTLATNSVFILDAVDVYRTTISLPVGQYEDDHPLLRFDSNWSPIISGLYTQVRGMRTTTNNADMLFYMNGTYVELGAFLSPSNQLDICTKDGQFDRADYADNPGSWTCETWPAAGTVSYARQIYGRAFPNMAVRSVLVRHRAFNPPRASAVIDYVNIYNSLDPLPEGRYEDTHPKLRAGLMLADDTRQSSVPAWTPAALNWATLPSPVYSGGSLVQTSTPDDYLVFDFNGTGFEIGSVTDVFGSEVEICYAAGTISDDFGGSTFDPTLFNAASPYCFTYQNETAAPNNTTARTVNGLTTGNYTVRVRHLDVNGSAVYPTMSVRTWNVLRLRVDYVAVYNNSPLPPAVTSGSFNDNAADGSGNPYLQLAPANRWRQITDWRALTYANRSFTGIVDDFGTVTNRFVGPVATLRVNVSAPGATVILDTGNPSFLNSDQLLACVNHVSGDGTVTTDNGTCRVLTTMRTSRYQVLQIGHSGASADYLLTFRTLTPGFFNIAAFQVIPGNTLTAGIYEDFLMAGTGIKTYNDPSFSLFTVTNNANSEDWRTLALAPYTSGRAFSTEFRRDTSPPSNPSSPNVGGSLAFTFTGTGFSIGTALDRWGSEMRICYQHTSWSAEVCEDFQNEFARVSYTASRTVVGLERGTYNVRVENRDDGQSVVVPSLPRNTQVFPARLVIDYVQVFDDGAALPPLTPTGVYNDTDSAGDGRRYLQLAPANRWNAFTGPAAFAYSGQSYTAVVNDLGQYSPVYAGAAAALHVNVPAVGSTTITLTTGFPSAANSRELQACYRRTDVLDTQFACEMVAPGMWTSRQQTITLSNNVNVTSAGNYLVVFRTLTPGFFLIDGFEVRTINTTVLGAGVYENTQMSANPSAPLRLSGDWTTVTSPIYSGGSAAQTELPSNQTSGGGSLEFTFEGTGFAVSTVVDLFGSEMRICYVGNDDFDGAWDGSGTEFCYDYQNESRAPNFYTLRTIAGLKPGVYRAYIANLNDGLMELTKHIPGATRYAFYPARLRIDFVQVFNTDLPPVVPPGTYNDDAATSGGTPYLQFAPSNRWARVTGRPAFAYFNQSYRGIGDPLGRVSTLYPGSALIMQVEVPSRSQGGLATIVLDTGNPSFANSAQILACAYNAATGARDKCEVLRTAQASRFQVFSLTNSGSAAVNRVVTFSTLTTGFFNVAGFQVIAGNTLTEGVYDDYLFNPSAGALIEQTGVWQQGLTIPLSKHPFAVGGSQQRTQDPSAALRFQFEGTGFSIITMQWSIGLDFQACYERWTGSGWGAPVCQSGSNDSRGPLNFQYGQSYYGLPYGRYRVEVKLKPGPQQSDGAISPWEWLYVDTIAIFGDVATVDDGTGNRVPNAPLLPGMYDDRDLLNSGAVKFGPVGTWTVPALTFYGPPFGPWNRTEQFTIRAGSTLSLFVRGNGLTLYQQFNWINSSSVRVCLAQSGGSEMLCSDFSQNGPFKFFSPIAFYGLGRNQNHHIIFENRSPGQRFNVDAVQVIP
ncbi:MAG: S8 family serine peptidase [Aggregatilineales bacterium]